MAAQIEQSTVKPRTRAKKSKGPVENLRSSISEMERIQLRDFVYFAVGDPHLTAYEENFINSMKQRLFLQYIYISPKQAKILGEIKEKLHYDRPNDPLPEIDPDGIVENSDPDGLSIDADGNPIKREPIDQFDEEDPPFFD